MLVWGMQHLEQMTGSVTKYHISLQMDLSRTLVPPFGLESNGYLRNLACNGLEKGVLS